MTLSTYQLKSGFQRLLAPALNRLVAWGVSPDAVTTSALLLSLAWGAVLWAAPGTAWPWACTPLVLLLRMALNALDGMLARRTGRITRRGALLNEVGDVLSDWALLLPWLVVPGVPDALVWAIALGATLAEFAGVLAVSVGAARRFDGPMGKSDRAVAMGLLALVHAAGGSAGWLVAGWALVALLLVWTVLNRLSRALRAAPPTR